MAAVLLLLPAVYAQPAEPTPADLVNPLVDTHKSRWFYFASACRPFGMVNLSPDTRVGGDWMYGYLYGDTKIQCFSHIHAWQLYGVPVMPITGEFHAQEGLAAAVEEVRRAETRQDAAARAQLEKTCWLWRKNPEGWTEQEALRWGQLKDNHTWSKADYPKKAFAEMMLFDREND